MVKLHQMEQCWRWYGPQDPVTLNDIRQTGATGIVTALHHIPHGDIWSVNEILKRKSKIEKAGFTWSVVESIPVHEDIKTQIGNYKKLIENYKTSIRNIGQAGIPIVTYNFMPVNDWTRTSINYKMPDGSLALYFDWTDLAVFDIFILKRPNADKDYSKDIITEAGHRFRSASPSQLNSLEEAILSGIPGERKNTPKIMLQKIKVYKNIDANILRANLAYFQKEISVTAQEAGVKLAIHPDDPPFPIFGLPRVVSTMEDFEYLFSKVDNPANGVCFCTGSLGASTKNNLPEMVKKLNKRIHFIHLRNVTRNVSGNFFEATHLGGDNDMYAIVKEILLLLQKLKVSIPFRPDHGHQMLDDLNKKTNPGYSVIGRMQGLAEIRGLELGIINSL